MIPWLLTIELLSKKSTKLSELVGAMITQYPCSGEINFKVQDSDQTIQKILSHYQKLHPEINRVDGISCDFGDWRFNVRASNTEPLLRLNVEARGEQAQQLMQEKTSELKQIIAS